MQQVGNDHVRGSSGPLLAKVTNIRYLMDFPDGTEKLFAADIEATREGAWTRDFCPILFVEGPSAAIIYGIEFEDGYPHGLVRERALKQQAFIGFLRDQNRENRRLLGPLADVFRGGEYSSELLVTQAYLLARHSALDAGIGYMNSITNQYERFAIESEFLR